MLIPDFLKCALLLFDRCTFLHTVLPYLKMNNDKIGKTKRNNKKVILPSSWNTILIYAVAAIPTL